MQESESVFLHVLKSVLIGCGWRQALSKVAVNSIDLLDTKRTGEDVYVRLFIEERLQRLHNSNRANILQMKSEKQQVPSCPLDTDFLSMFWTDERHRSR